MKENEAAPGGQRHLREGKGEGMDHKLAGAMLALETGADAVLFPPAREKTLDNRQTCNYTAA